MSGRVAFVVIGRNEGERLRPALEALLTQSRKVIYVDSASTDRSAELARKLGTITIVLGEDEPLSAALGRNTGFAEARRRFPECEFVQFIDGDCVIADAWIDKAVAFMDSAPRAAVACGRRTEAHPEASLYNRLIDEEWDTPVGRSLYSGGDSLVRVSAFEQVGGFRSELRAGEEPEMTTRLRTAGWEVWRLDAPMTTHDARMLRFDQWWQRSVRGGYGYAQVWTMTRRNPESVFGPQLRSAIFWALSLPLLVCLAAILLREPLVLLLLPTAWFAQIARIAARRGFSPRAWLSAAMLLLAKLPETVGVLNYFRGQRADRLTDYKATAK